MISSLSLSRHYTMPSRHEDRLQLVVTINFHTSEIWLFHCPVCPIACFVTYHQQYFDMCVQLRYDTYLLAKTHKTVYTLWSCCVILHNIAFIIKWITNDHVIKILTLVNILMHFWSPLSPLNCFGMEYADSGVYICIRIIPRHIVMCHISLLFT